jgi:hypothetical protein
MVLGIIVTLELQGIGSHSCFLMIVKNPYTTHGSFGNPPFIELFLVSWG